MNATRSHLRPLAHPAPADTRTDLERLCAGEPVLVDHVDLIEFANSSWAGLDRDVDPGDHLLAQVLLAWFHDHVGLERRTEGDRSTGIAGDLRRYLLPFAIETAFARPAAERSVSHLRVADLRDLPRILAGDLPLPAATVAGDLLRRRAVTCVWLSLDDAGAVSLGGRAAVRAGLADGTIPRHCDARGRLAVLAADLRSAGLLIEREPDQDPEVDDDEPSGHGLETTTAANILSIVAMATDHARANGAELRGDFHVLRAIKPIPSRRKRRPAPPASLVTLETVRRICRHLHPTAQVVVWCLRLAGLRISELYGVYLSDLLVVDGRWYMRIRRQGGRVALQRSSTGALSVVEVKERTKTAQSKRIIPLPFALSDLLASYIDIYHTDPDTGVRVTDARLIVGLRNDNTSGQAAVRASIVQALAQEGITHGHDGSDALSYFHPHDLRAGLITDLANAGADKRVREMYTGHWSPKDAHDGYDRGATSTELLTIAEATDTLITARSDLTDLRVPTAKRESFGKETRLAPLKVAIRNALRECDWYDPAGAPTSTDADAADQPPLSAAEVAERLGVSPQHARLLMREGTIESYQVSWGRRQVWVASSGAVDAYLAARSDIRLADLARSLGLTYHQTLELAKTLGVLPVDRDLGEIIFLAPEAVSTLRGEMKRRRAAFAEVMDLQSAAKRLGLPLGQVERMVRNKTLETAPSPTGVRRRYVSRGSVEAVAATAITSTDVGDGRVVSLRAAQDALDVNRYQLSDLIRTGQVAATTVNRRQSVWLAAALAYGRREGIAPHRLAQLEAAAVPVAN